MSAPRISVVIPTFQRRELVIAAVRSLEKQRDAPPFEVVVAVDGSTDGTADAVRRLDAPWLTVVEQPNRGAAAARNAGARVATGEVLLFLDDDMEAAPDLLAVHDREHRGGADVVLGDMPLHPDTPATVVSAAVGSWAQERAARLARDATLELHDLLTGQISISRAAFDDVGGFDADFTHEGAFGGEDLDVGHRLRREGRTIVFAPDAISLQRYSVSGRSYLRQWEQAGRSDAMLARKHPELLRELPPARPSSRGARILAGLGGLGPAGRALLDGAGWVAARVIDGGRLGATAAVVAFGVRDALYARGRADADRGEVTVLALHAIADLRGDAILEPYALPAAELDRLLHQLARRHRFVSLDDVIAGLSGTRPLPRRGVLLTFDDGYADLATEVAPRLRAHDIPAAAFVVSGLLGATNVWDEAAGAASMRLLDADALRELTPAPLAVGAHSRTHPQLTRIAPAALDDEIAGSRTDLAAAGLPLPEAFCFPYGDVDDAVVDATRAAGYRAAFTLAPGVVRPGADPLRLPRVEVHRADPGIRLAAKLAAARRGRELPRPVARLLGVR